LPQDNAAATYAPILKKTDGLVDWTADTEQIICRIMGMQPWPTAFSYLHGQVWKFLRAEPFDDRDGLYFGASSRKPEYDPGRVTALIKGRGFTVKTGGGHLLVTGCQPAGKKVITGADAVNGNLLRKGDDFVSDEKFLDGTSGVE
jgi:methionyl-tRNA formyltransferase